MMCFREQQPLIQSARERAFGALGKSADYIITYIVILVSESLGKTLDLLRHRSPANHAFVEMGRWLTAEGHGADNGKTGQEEDTSCHCFLVSVSVIGDNEGTNDGR